ncbi:MAG TPA: SPOR domain-containing protein [Bacillota bacterium]|nr:SPOR domain-containing protein [Bacillota bacterium]
MENKNRNPKTITNLLSKILGLVFFSCLAISLGVVFGLLFDGWVKYQPGTPVGTENSTLQTVDLSDQGTDPDQSATVTDSNSGNTTNTTNTVVDNSSPTATESETTTNTKTVTAVKFKVRVGPYADRTQAVAASGQLKNLGYPVFVGPNPPFAVQVGAFSTQSNAEKLKTELTSKGYKVFIDKNP